MYWLIIVLSVLTVAGIGAMCWAFLPNIKDKLFERHVRRKAKRLNANEAVVDLDELKRRLEDDEENFIRESEAPVLRVPSTVPPPPGTPRTITDLLLDDVEPEEIERMLLDGRARRD